MAQADKPRTGLKISIRYKILGLIGTVLLLAMVSYVLLALTLFTRDKIAYVFDLNSTLTQTLAQEVDLSFDSLVDKLRYFGVEAGSKVVPEAAPSKRKRRRRAKNVAPAASADPSEAALRLVGTEKDVLVLEIWERGVAGPMERVFRWSDPERLADLNIALTDLDEARRTRPIPWRTVMADGRYVQNSSLPPDLALLTVAVGLEDGRVVLADIRPERFLRIFGQSDLVTAFLVDRRGSVLAHPDSNEVLSGANLREHALVANALERVTERAVHEFRSEDGQEWIGGFATIKDGLASVITEVPKAEALRAGQELVRKSILFAVGILLVGFLLSIFFARQMAAPINRLEAATIAVARGDFSMAVDLNIKSRDEVATLATAFTSMIKDLSERDVRLGEAHQQLVQSEKLATIGELSAGISHEVKNPLAGMRGFAQLGRRTSDLEEAHEYFKLIEDETHRALDILNNLLKFSRRDDASLVPLSINDVVKDAVRLVSHQLQVKGVKVELSLADPIPQIRGDGNQLRQVLINLAINAQHAMEGRGTKALAFKTVAENGHICVLVTDTGCGMAEDVKSSLFKPFFTTKGEGMGTGLGMSVSSRIVEGHRGTIEVESEVDVGTTFRIQFPTIADASATPT